MEFKGDYSKSPYREQFEQLDNMLQNDSELEELLQEDKLDGLKMGKNYLGDLEDVKREILEILGDIEQARRDLHMFVSAAKENPVALGRSMGPSLTRIWKNLDRAKELPGKLDALRQALGQAPEEMKAYPEFAELQKFANVEENLGRQMEVTARKVQQASVEMSSIATLEITGNMRKIYATGYPETGEKSVKELREQYGEDLKAYDRQRASYTEKHSEAWEEVDWQTMSANKVDLILQDAHRRAREAKEHRDLVHSQEYVDAQRDLHEKTLEAHKATLSQINDLDDTIRDQEDFMKDLQRLPELFEQIRLFQEAHKDEKAEDLLEQEKAVDREIKRLQKQLSDSEEGKNWAKAQEDITLFKKRHKTTDKTVQEIQDRIKEAERLQEMIDSLSTEAERNVLRNGLVFLATFAAKEGCSAKELADKQQMAFQLTFGTSLSPEHKLSIARRIKTALGQKWDPARTAEELKDADLPSLSDLREFIGKKRTGLIKDKAEDHLMDPLMIYAGIMDLEGMEGPSYIKKQKQTQLDETGVDAEAVKLHILTALRGLIQSHEDEAELMNVSQQYGEISSILADAKKRGATEDIDALQKQEAVLLEKVEALSQYGEKQSQAQTRLGELAKQYQATDYFKIVIKDLGFAPYEEKKGLRIEEYLANSILDVCRQESVTRTGKEGKKQNQIAKERYSKLSGQIEEMHGKQNDFLMFIDREKHLQSRMQIHLRSQLLDQLKKKMPGSTAEAAEICKLYAQKSAALLNDEGILLDGNFAAYRNLQEKGDKAERSYRYSGLYEQLQNELFKKAQIKGKQEQLEIAQYGLLRPLTDQIRSLLDNNMGERIETFNGRQSEQILRKMLEKLEKAATEPITFEFMNEVTSFCKDIAKKAEEKVITNRSRVMELSKKSFEEQAQIEATGDRAIAARQKSADRALEVARENEADAAALHQAKEKAATTKQDLLKQEQKLSQVYNENGQRSYEDCKEQIQSQISTFLNVTKQDRLPKKWTGSNTTAYENITIALENLSQETDLVGMVSGLKNLKAAAEAYVAAKESGFHWFSKAPVTASGRARLDLARDIIKFCQMEEGLLKDYDPVLMTTIKRVVEESRAEQTRLFEGTGQRRAVEKNTALQMDIDYCNEQRQAKEEEAQRREEARQDEERRLEEQRQAQQQQEEQRQTEAGFNDFVVIDQQQKEVIERHYQEERGELARQRAEQVNKVMADLRF